MSRPRLLLPLALALVASAPAAADDERPNFVFLLTDDQCTYSMGCYGNDDVLTPHLDQLAADGMIFDRHYNTTAICMASRANIVTGMFEYKSGTNFEHGPMAESLWRASYPIVLREAGYLTAFAGKIGFEVQPEAGGKSYLPEDDFDMWGAGPGQTNYSTKSNASMAHYAADFPHSTLSYAAFSRDFFKLCAEADDDAPFCLSISFKAAHRPTTPDPQFDEVYAGKTFTKPDNYGREAGAHMSEQSRSGRQFPRFEEWGYSDRYDEVMAIYHQQIYGVDVAVGRIREALIEHGFDQDTVVIFTSDNGFFCGSHGLGSKVLPYEESARCPLIVFDPRHPSAGKAQRCDALTGNVDFAPTMLAMAGLEVPEDMDGADLTPLLDDPSADIHDALPLINVWGTPAAYSLGIVTRDLKYVYWPHAGDGMEEAEELFDLRKDSGEMVNRATDPEYAPQLSQLREHHGATVQDWRAEAVEFNDYQRFADLFDRSLPWSEKVEKTKRAPRERRNRNPQQ